MSIHIDKLVATGLAGSTHPGVRKFSFVGVTTGGSAIRRVFPAWAVHLGLENVELATWDLPVGATPSSYREVITAIKEDPANLGGLITTHKVALFEACRDMFDETDPLAGMCREVSCLSKRNGTFRAHAKDPVSSARCLAEMVPPGHWAETRAEVLLLGAGGANLAISVHLLSSQPEDARPAGIIAVDKDEARLSAMGAVHRRLMSNVPVRYVLGSDPRQNDALLATLPPGSLVVNGTGMGKDIPGCPLTPGAVFPYKAIAWELNYRGELDFLQMAEQQMPSRSLVVRDGWRYFVHGWACAIEETFGLEIGGQLLEELSQIALRHREPKEARQK